ncbi:MAG: metallophosphoesterase [Candidatus Lokiarchaeota archaeon]
MKKKTDLINKEKEKRNILSILHFSDIHFGDDSAQVDETRKGDFSNLFANFKLKLNKIIEKEDINLILITGDISSKSSLFPKKKLSLADKIGKIIRRKREDSFTSIKLPEYLEEFIEIFSLKRIPILITIGNHDLIRKSNDRKRFYLLIYELLEDRLHVKKSKNFQENLINYYHLKEDKILFFSVDTTFSLSERGNWEDANIDLARIDNFFKEMNNQGYYDIENYLIFLITHHSLGDIPNNKSVLIGLAERNIKIVFSGHIHDRKKDLIDIPDSKYNLLNYIAGSPLISKKKREEGYGWNLKSLQFNHYKIYLDGSSKLQAYYYELDSNDNWKRRDLDQDSLDKYHQNS